jgi:metallo-beta-lactamase class B
MGTVEDQTSQFPPHKIVGNIYYVGTKTLSSFLIVTPEGNILIDSTYERNVPVIQKSVTDARLQILRREDSARKPCARRSSGGRCARQAADRRAGHGDGGRRAALQAMKPGGKEHPIDKVLHDQDKVTLGGVTPTAHLTPGHTRGCTSWTTTVQESGKTYNVLFGCSLRPARCHYARDRG